MPPRSRRLPSFEASEQERLQTALRGGKKTQLSSERSSSNEPAGAPGTAQHHPKTAAAGTAAKEAGQPQAGSWEDWMRYFYAMDDTVQELHSLQSEINEAVEQEDYSKAAALRKQQFELERADCVGEALDALDEAVEEERFEDAARLRDEASVGIMGWWVGRGDGDPTGHLMRITPDFGRYVATVYAPRDIAELLPELRASGGAQMMQFAAAALAGQAMQPPEAPAPQPEEAGLPVLELFLRRKAGGQPGFDKQAVALYAPNEMSLTDDDVEGDGGAGTTAIAGTLAEMIAAAETDGETVVSVERGRNPDGSSFVKIEIGQRDDEGDEDGGAAGAQGSGQGARGPDSDSEDDDIRTIDDLAASVGVTPSSRGGDDSERRQQWAAADAAGSDDEQAQLAAGSGAAEDGESEAAELRQWQEQIAAAVLGLAAGDASALEALEGLGSGSEGAGTSSGDNGSDDEAGSGGILPAEEMAAIAEALMRAGDGDMIQISVDAPDGSDSVEVTLRTGGGTADGSDGTAGSKGGGEGESEAEAAAALGSAASRLGCILQRAPAELEWRGRDEFVVSVKEPPALAAARAAAEAAAAPAATVMDLDAPPEQLELKRPPLRIIYDGKEQQRGGGQGSDASSAALQGRDGSSSSGGSEDDVIDVEVVSEPSDSEEISVLLAAQQRRQQEQQRQQEQAREEPQQQSSDEEDESAKESAALAEGIEAVRAELEAGRQPPREKINELARRALGLAIAQGVGAADASGNPLGANRWAALEGRTTYQRLRLIEVVKTDPFSGLYLGTFGPHGPELLQVRRQVLEDGREWAVATKVTGDPNVPAGTVSWKAVIGRENRLPVSMYPPEMGVTARYKGQGQVAQTGFANAKWVDGELLTFAPDSPFVRGAQLGFTFDVRRNQRYLIVLHRVNLDEFFPQEQ